MPLFIFVLLIIAGSAAIAWWAWKGFCAAKFLMEKDIESLIVLSALPALVGILASGIFRGSLDVHGANMIAMSNMMATMGLFFSAILIATSIYIQNKMKIKVRLEVNK